MFSAILSLSAATHEVTKLVHGLSDGSKGGSVTHKIELGDQSSLVETVVVGEAGALVCHTIHVVAARILDPNDRSAEGVHVFAEKVVARLVEDDSHVAEGSHDVGECDHQEDATLDRTLKREQSLRWHMSRRWLPTQSPITSDGCLTSDAALSSVTFAFSATPVISDTRLGGY